MTTRTITNEPCTHCRAPVVINEHTIRSTYGQKALCNRCAEPGPEYRFTNTALEHRTYDRRVRCDSCGQLKRKSKSAKVGDGWVCNECADEGTDLSYKARARVEEILERRGRLTPEERARGDAWLEVVIRTAQDPCPDRPQWEYRVEEDDGHEDRDEDEYRAHTDGGAEVRFIDWDDTPVFGVEPDGVPRDGVAYESRWWVPGGHTDRDGWRDYDAQMELV